MGVEQEMDRSCEENAKIVEVDSGAGEPARRGGEYGHHGRWSPAPSAMTEVMSPRAYSGHFEDMAFAATAHSSPHHASASSELLCCPSYMANTESSRAKARSQSAPRQRHDQPISAAASPSPSPSCGEWTTTPGDRRRRASLDPRDLAAPASAAGVGVGARMERCASQARASASASAACPWAVRMDRSTASLAGGSDGGSSAATAVTAATAARVTS